MTVRHFNLNTRYDRIQDNLCFSYLKEIFFNSSFAWMINGFINGYIKLKSPQIFIFYWSRPSSTYYATVVQVGKQYNIYIKLIKYTNTHLIKQTNTRKNITRIPKEFYQQYIQLVNIPTCKFFLHRTRDTRYDAHNTT